MNCKHCGAVLRVCEATSCRGWYYGNGCTGWVHHDLFHGCPDGKHQAEPSVTVDPDDQPRVEGSAS